MVRPVTWEKIITRKTDRVGTLDVFVHENSIVNAILASTTGSFDYDFDREKHLVVLALAHWKNSDTFLLEWSLL